MARSAADSRPKLRGYQSSVIRKAFSASGRILKVVGCLSCPRNARAADDAKRSACSDVGRSGGIGVIAMVARATTGGSVRRNLALRPLRWRRRWWWWWRSTRVVRLAKKRPFPEVATEGIEDERRRFFAIVGDSLANVLVPTPTSTPVLGRRGDL